MTDDNTPAPAPTNDDLAAAMRIRDELATRIRSVRATSDYGNNSSIGKLHSAAVAEALIAQGLIDLGRVHRDITDPVVDVEF